MKTKRFILNNKGQALIETAIFMFFIGILISIFFVQIGYIEIVRLRLAMANCYMVYSQAHDINPNTGRSLTDKVSLMLSNGPPVIQANSANFGNINININENPFSIAGIRLPFGPRIVKGTINADYKFNSIVMKKIMGGQTSMNIGSGQLEQYKETLYISPFSLDGIKNILGSH